MKKSLSGIFLMAMICILSLGSSSVLNAQTNLALGQPVTASSVKAYAAANAVDGNATTRWSSNYNQPEWIYVDLGQNYSINQVILNWETAYGSGYEIQVSDNASSWTTIYSTTTGNGGIDDLTGLSGSGRYVRMYGTARATSWGFSLYEFEVYGTDISIIPVTGVSVTPTTLSLTEGQTSNLTETVSPSNATDKTVTWSSNNTAVATVNASGLVTAVAAGSATITVTTNDGSFTANCAVTVSAAPTGNIALGRPVTASSVKTYAAEDAVDGNATTRWASNYNEPEWIYVDLGQTYSISRVVLSWETAYGLGYEIQVSDNASSWTSIYTTTTGNGGIDDLTGLSGSGRYVRMYGTARATGWGFSLYEFEVYGTTSSFVVVTGVSVAPTSLTLDEGQTSDLTETVSPSNATNKSVTWSSSNTSVATVNASGLVTAVAAGNATITVTTNDGSFTANCAVSVNAVSSGVISSTTWQTFGLSAQTGAFTATFYATPNNNNMDGLVGILNSTATGYGDLACIVRFNSGGQIDARNGGSYTATNVVNYSAGTSYYFRLEINVSAHTYSVFVTPSGSSEQVVANNFAFRSEQSGVTQLNGWALYAASGTHTVNNVIFTAGAPDVQVPSIPGGLTAGTVTQSSVALSWNASTDNVGVTGYKVYTNGANPVTVGSTSTNISGLSASTLYNFTVSAIDASGNESAQSTALPVTTQQADVTAPSIPGGLTEGVVTQSSVSLSWNASTDNVGVTGYNVYKGGVFATTTAGTSTTVSGLTPNTSYNITVTAFDAVGNESDPSTALSVTTDDISGDWPNLSNTGTSGVLTPYTGNVTTSSNGQLIENLEVSGSIVVNHENVIIRNCKFGSLDIKTTTPTTGLNCVVEDCEMTWAGRQNFTLRRCFMTVRSEDLIRISGPNVTVEDCYLLITGPRDDGDHSDIIQEHPDYTAVNCTINHNTMHNELDATSCIISKSPLVVTNNLMAGGSYVMYIYNSYIANNHFSNIFFPGIGNSGIIYGSGNNCVDNIFHESGVPFNCPSSGEVVEFAEAIQQDVKVYPNPVSGGTLNIQLTGYDANEVNVKITDITGRTVYNQLYTVQSQLELPVDALSKGIYVVSVVGEGINNQQKLIVE